MSVIQESNNAYAAVTQVDGAVSETEQRRLEQQAEVYSRLAGWTLDALGLGPGHRVLAGCGKSSCPDKTQHKRDQCVRMSKCGRIPLFRRRAKPPRGS